MDKLKQLQEILYERLHRRPPGIDKLDRLWEAAVLLPLVQTEQGIAVLFEERAHSLRRQPGEICFPGGKVECSDANNFAVTVSCVVFLRHWVIMSLSWIASISLA